MNPYFDLHCDTLLECDKRNVGLYNNGLCIDLAKSKSLKPYIQCCATWLPDEIRGEAATEHFIRLADILTKESERGDFVLCKSAEDMNEVKDHGLTGIILTVEGGAVINQKLQNIKMLAEHGVKMMTLTWNGENEIGTGVGCENAEYGLSDFGKSVISEMEENHIAVDISHASEKLFWDVYENSSKAFAASHSNAKTLCSHRRNLTDKQFEAIISRGGIVGINFSDNFLENIGDMASKESIFEHADYFMSLGGKDVVAMGSDFDGTRLPKDIRGIENTDDIKNVFAKHNYTEEQINKIFFGNAFDFMLKFF